MTCSAAAPGLTAGGAAAACCGEPGADHGAYATCAESPKAPLKEAATVDWSHRVLGIFGITGSAVVSSVPGINESAASVPAIVPLSCSCSAVVSWPSDG